MHTEIVMSNSHPAKDTTMAHPQILRFCSKKCRYIIEFLVFTALLYGIYHYGYETLDINFSSDNHQANNMKLVEQAKRRAEYSTAPSASQTLNVDLSTPIPLTTPADPNLRIQEILQGETSVHFVKPNKPRTFNKMWQIVNDSQHESYLYSAWYDDRPTLGRAKSVRIIGVQDEKISSLLCLLWYKGLTNPDISLAITIKAGATMPRHGVYFQSVVLSCEVLVVRKQPPEYVSVVSGNVTHPTTLLKVQVAEKPGFPYEFGQCVSITYWKHDPYRIVEWMEMQQILGVQEITIYNNSLIPQASRVFRHYVRENLVDLRQMPSCMADEGEITILLLMSCAINDCMYRNMYRYKWIVCTDLDEIIVPRIDLDYAGMLETINKLQPPKAQPYSTYVFRNAYFFFDLQPVSKEPWFLQTLIYLKRVNISQYGYASKSITDPMSCVALQNHVCWYRTFKRDRPGWFLPVDPSIATSHHYKNCHFDAYLQKPGTCAEMMKIFFLDTTMFNFTDTLVDRVSERLFKLDLIGNDKNKLFDGYKELMPETDMDEYGSDYETVSQNDDEQEPEEVDYKADIDDQGTNSNKENEEANDYNEIPDKGINDNQGTKGDVNDENAIDHMKSESKP